MPERYYVEADIRDIYTRHRLVLPEDLLPEDKWVQEIEFRRGSELVHHFNIFVKAAERSRKPVVTAATWAAPPPGRSPHVWPKRLRLAS